MFRRYRDEALRSKNDDDDDDEEEEEEEEDDRRTSAGVERGVCSDGEEKKRKMARFLVHR